jgi:nucleoside-triphosphatase
VIAKNVLVTGRPGIGKTTAVLRAVGELRKAGLRVGGFVSREERKGGVRTGFVIVDLETSEEAYLARVGEGGPRIGKYVVLVGELERVGVAAIRRALQSAQVVVIDEIGPMELLSQSFKQAVAGALNSPKPVVATIHVRAREDPFGRSVLSRKDVALLEVNLSNRERIPGEIARLVLAYINASGEKAQ